MNPALKWMPLVVSIALVATGCARDGYYHDRNIDYAKAGSSAPLVLPESRDRTRYGNAMPVPETSREFAAADDGFSAPRPPAGMGSARRDYVERRSLDQDSWLVVDAVPDTVWPRLEDFARRQGLSVSSSDPARGVLETAQGRLSVRHGVQAGSSEVRCERGGQVHADCLESLSNYLSGQSQTASALATQQRSNEPQHMRLERQDEGWLLVLRAAPEQVWTELSYQLEEHFDRENREVLLERNAESRDFLVEYMTESERQRGFLSIVFSPDVRQMTQQLRLTLEPAGGETLVRVINESERAFTPDDSREFLERVAALLR